LLLGRGEEQSGGRNKTAILADTFEALIGAFYLDQGFELTLEIVRRYFQDKIEAFEHISGKDFKSILQEYAQKQGLELPDYRIAKIEGPDHQRRYYVICEFNSESYGPFVGQTKKEAEQQAAQKVFEVLHAHDAFAAQLLDTIAGGELPSLNHNQ